MNINVLWEDATFSQPFQKSGPGWKAELLTGYLIDWFKKVSALIMMWGGAALSPWELCLLGMNPKKEQGQTWVIRLSICKRLMKSGTWESLTENIISTPFWVSCKCRTKTLTSSFSHLRAKYHQMREMLKSAGLEPIDDPSKCLSFLPYNWRVSFYSYQPLWTILFAKM